MPWLIYDAAYSTSSKLGGLKLTSKERPPQIPDVVPAGYFEPIIAAGDEAYSTRNHFFYSLAAVFSPASGSPDGFEVSASVSANTIMGGGFFKPQIHYQSCCVFVSIGAPLAAWKSQFSALLSLLHRSVDFQPLTFLRSGIKMNFGFSVGAINALCSMGLGVALLGMALLRGV